MTIMLAVANPVAYDVLDHRHLDECVTIMSEIFSKGEPLTKILNINLYEFCYFAEVFAKKAIEEELAIFAKERETGNMLGFCLSEDLLTQPPAGVEFISPKFAPIIQLIDQMDEWFTSRHRVAAGQYLHILLTGISRRCRHRDVSLRVVAENLRLAEQKGFSGALGESTTTLAARAAMKNGFREQFAISYQDFKIDGDPVFKDMGPKAKCRLMVKWFT